jgi:TonB family protein
MSPQRSLTLLLIVLASWLAAVAQTAQVVDVDEAGIRKSAYKKTLPTFPESSRKRRSEGVAVVQLVYDGTGTVVEVEVLEAPDAEIGEAIVNAVRHWKFKPSSIRGKPVNIRGKLTFYCVIDPKGIGRVQNPKQFR